MDSVSISGAAGALPVAPFAVAVNKSDETRGEIMKKTIWSYLILFCVCLLVFITIVASAEESLGENIILEEAVGDQTLDRMNYSVYNAEIKQWDPSTVNALDYGIDAGMKEKTDSYGGHAWLWDDGQRELYVSDYGYAGFSTLNGMAMNDILVWYGGCSALQLGSADLKFATSTEAVQTADVFLKSFGITNVECLTVNSFSKETAESKLSEMQAEGYEENQATVSDAYILSYAVEVDGLLCDTELFTMANQRDIEGIVITVIVDADGVIYMSFSGPYYTATEVRSDTPSEVLSFDEIKQIVAAKFDNLILSDPVRICAVKLQYVVLPVNDHQMAYTPCWCFATPRGSSDRYVWYRFNAYTGVEII